MNKQQSNQWTWSLNHSFRTVLLLGVLILAGSPARATHFRYGTLTWQQAGQNASGQNIIRFTLNTSWRRGFNWTAGGTWTGRNPPVGVTIRIGTMYFGDGTTTTVLATVNSFDSAADIVNTTWTATHTYATTGNYVANALNDCCRLSSISVNHDIGFNLQTIVNVGTTNNSPVSSLPAIINVPVNATSATFTIPGTDPDGDLIRYRLSRTGVPSTGNTPTTVDTFRESGLTDQDPPGFVLQSNGTFTMNTVGRTVDSLYAVQVMMEDRNSASSPRKSKSPVDFLIRMVPASRAPVFVTPTPKAPNNVFNVLPGNTVSFTVAARDSDINQYVILKPVAVPLGSTMIPALPVSGPVNDTVRSTFSWTPTAAQVGTYVITFVAADTLGVQTLTSVTINVPCALDITSSVTDATCAGDSNGAVTITPQNYSSLANLRYAWSSLTNSFTSTNQNISNIISGIYTLRVDDVGTGCFTRDTIFVYPTPINIFPTATNVLCNGGSTGTITVSANGGRGGYLYSIDNGTTYQSTASFTGLTANTYQVVVKDSSGCLSAVQSVSITQPTLLTAAISSHTNVTCPGGSDGALAVSASGGTPVYTYAWSPAGGTGTIASNLSTGIYIVTVTDAKGCQATASATVVQVDTVVPTITAPSAITVFADSGVCTASNVALGTSSTSDNCAVTVSNNAPATFALGANTVVWTVTDGSNNSSSANQIVTVVDNQAPVPNVASLPAATGQCSVTVTAPTAIDNCAGTITATTSDPTTYSVEGTYTITWTYNDGNGNTSTQTQSVVVDDITAPVANAASLAIITGECSAAITSAPTATDNCVGTVTGATTDPLVYTTQGTYTVHWVYNDGLGNTSTQNQTVVVDDITAPVANNATLPTVTGECSATVTTVPSATDNCVGAVTGTTSDPLTYNTQGTYTVHWIYNDGNGNTSTQNQTVIVDDITTPVPNAATLPTASGECSASVTAPTATDNCVGTVTATTSDPTTYTAQGTHTVHWIYNDGNGNTSTQNQTVIVQDVTPPTINGTPANITVNNDLHVCGAVVSWTVPTPADNCSGSTIAQTAGLPRNSVFPIGTTTVTYTATDVNNNTYAASFTVTVIDNEMPVLTCPANIVACNNPVSGNTRTLTLTATDNCTISISYAITGATSGTGTGGTVTRNFNVGTSTITWTVTDASNNVSTCSTTVIIRPSPVVTTISASPTYTVGNCSPYTIYIGYGPQTINLTANASGGTTPYSYAWTPASSATSPSAATTAVSPIATTVYNVTVTDANGCSASSGAGFTVKVKDVRCGNNNNKVAICRNGNTSCISPNAVPSHISGGDCLGDCSIAFAKGTAPVHHTNLEEGSIVVYPNPAHIKINVALKDVGSAYRSYEITDINGRVIASHAFSGDIYADLISVDVSNYVPGIYIIRAVTENGTSLTKFTVE